MALEVDPEVGKQFVEHFGTKGMRWGVRRTRAERAAGKGEKEETKGKKGSKDTAKPKVVVGRTKIPDKKASEMSDAQLKRVINRQNMEQQYAKLNAPGPTATQRVLRASSKFVTQAARNVAMTQVTQVANAEAAKRIATLMDARAAASTANNMARLGKKNISFG